MKRTRIWSMILLMAVVVTAGILLLSGSGKKTVLPRHEKAYQPMKMGVSYYPERRPREKWEKDLEMMREAGIQRIRIAEFSWSSMEPREGEFDFSWLDEFIALSEQYKLEVMMCTPTATPPIWLVENYPDVLPVDKEGRTTVFGARQHRDYHSENYLKYSLRITEELAKRYGKNENVVAWQIDNEMGGEQKWSFSKASSKAFRAFLKDKYGTIEALNERWVNDWWSMEYHNFDQINPPIEYAGTLSLKHHPSLELDFIQFASNSIVEYSNKQAAIIKSYVDDGVEVTTNRFAYAWGDNVDSFDLNATLDAAGFDLYSEAPHEIAFYADVNRTLNPDKSWVLEYSSTNKNLLEEMELLNSRGVSWVYFFKWNPFPAGQEQSLASLITITDEPTDNYYELQNWKKDVLEKEKTFYAPPSGIGVYFDFQSSWIHYLVQWGYYTERLVYQDYVINTVYRSVFDPKNTCEVIMNPEQIKDLHTLILPRQIQYDSTLEAKLIAFVKSGGTVITTHDLFQKNQDNVFLTRLPKIYTEYLKVEDNNFFYNVEEDKKIITQTQAGKGKIVIVNANSDYEDWENYYDSFVADQVSVVMK